MAKMSRNLCAAMIAGGLAAIAFSIHAWEPAAAHASDAHIAADAFGCRDKSEMERALDYLAESQEVAEHYLRSLPPGSCFIFKKDDQVTLYDRTTISRLAEVSIPGSFAIRYWVPGDLVHDH
jgi:hypothetical protein